MAIIMMEESAVESFKAFKDVITNPLFEYSAPLI